MGSEVEFLATKTVESGEPEKVPRFLEEISDKTYLVSDDVSEENAVQPSDAKNETSEETVDETDTEPAKDCNPRMAALMAVHLVSQVLDEAYLIANDAQESGQPWKFLSTGKNTQDNNIDETSLSSTSQLEESKGDNVNENNFETGANINATSTPQKNAARQIDYSEVTLTPSFNDPTLIGQGDEEIETEDDTSMYINQLFNMSDVERVIFCGTDDSTVIQNLSEPNDFLNDAMNKIMDSYVAHPFQPIEEFPAVMSSFVSNPFRHLEEHTEEQYNDLNENYPTEMLSSDYSEYSFLSDAYVADIGRDVTFYIEEGPSIKEEVYEGLRNDSVEERTEVTEADTFESGKTAIEQEKHNDFQLYENAYVTLNRDYDQCSEDDGYPILQDPKEMILQEVELMTSNTSDDEPEIPKATVSSDKTEEVDVSTLNGSRRSTLVRRCRYQGAKLFACLRGWWRRKAPGTRKESKRAVLSVCPLSPDARRRASSLLDNRLLRSPSPNHPMVWKFNTVNEVIVNSNRWKDYTFSTMPEEQRGDNI